VELDGEARPTTTAGAASGEGTVYVEGADVHRDVLVGEYELVAEQYNTGRKNTLGPNILQNSGWRNYR
jgi:hypothetical protein